LFLRGAKQDSRHQRKKYGRLLTLELRFLKGTLNSHNICTLKADAPRALLASAMGDQDPAKKKDICILPRQEAAAFFLPSVLTDYTDWA
jgi:hypothetical protein